MIKIGRVTYAGRPDCCQLENGLVQVIAAEDMGPRILCYRFIGNRNIFGKLRPEIVLKSDFGNCHLWGGHRLWHAPEVKPRTYCPDNDPIVVKTVGKGVVRLTQRIEPQTRIEKEVLVRLDTHGPRVTVSHKLTNRGIWPVKLAPWAISIMKGGGTTIIPNEPYLSEEQHVLPIRSMAIWPYTDLSDSRLVFGSKFIRLQTDENIQSPLKLGVMNKQGWAAYLCEKTLFIKKFPFMENARYTDYGCNFEAYTAGKFMEIESLGSLVVLEPGESTSHTEYWYLFNNIGKCDTDDTLEKAIIPCIQRTKIS